MGTNRDVFRICWDPGLSPDVYLEDADAVFGSNPQWMCGKVVECLFAKALNGPKTCISKGQPRAQTRNQLTLTGPILNPTLPLESLAQSQKLWTSKVSQKTVHQMSRRQKLKRSTPIWKVHSLSPTKTLLLCSSLSSSTDLGHIYFLINFCPFTPTGLTSPTAAGGDTEL